MTASYLPYNAAVPPGGSTAFGFNATPVGRQPAPDGPHLHVGNAETTQAPVLSNRGLSQQGE
ncbi:hypothetical protein AB0K23_07840 [Streptomyces sp. NPDC049602]|uniref:hypothetical protein n=1 Tax=Streptomyces sp. NPDC049602 TaxID=3155504 RepID=UPI00341C97A1